ncbi:DUF1015 domain-containing protein [Metallumcola ferriviriculae]|uniref:DUF1015 domain-containing protein n=1 Tax=Metallumcola ferriviriculae TaxID=3039180 RepID=A0AAU0UPW8_9FIRM|nr:DUF1015 domain-containing protein [Desulfitibacteraceae bacterium MK1]
MAEIVPIKGLRYNPKMVAHLEEVTTPPYDVIGPEAQNRFYEQHPYNIIRLELGKTYPDDDTDNNRYTRASEIFKQWQRDGILVQDSTPSLYLYRQEFSINGNTYNRTGFITGLKCVDYGRGEVLPHEETLPKAKTDRKLLLESCQANFSPIFGLYDEEEKSSQKLLLKVCQSKEPDCTVSDSTGVIHRLWAVTDIDVINKVQKNLFAKTIYIADGHHRYETALKHAEEMKAKGHDGYGHIMITLVNLHDDGLIILPTHRMIKNTSAEDLTRLLAESNKYFIIEKVAADAGALEDRLNETSKSAFAIYAGGDQAYFLTLRPDCYPETLYGLDKSLHWRKLDVAILHSMLLENVLGLGSAERASGDFITYTRNGKDTIDKVKNGDFCFSVLMRPTQVEQVTDVAGAGDKMPQKSTYFYPKLITGLVINPLGSK